jgi:uncharacterized protein YybS (DUF2232 family)
MNTKTRALSEAALVTALICVLGLAGIYLPVVGLFAYFSCAPLIILGKSYGLKYAATSLGASALIIGMFAGPLYTITLVLISGLSSATMGWLLNKEKPTYQVLGAGIVVSLFGAVATVALGQLLTGLPLIETITTAFDESLKLQQSMFGSLGADQTVLADVTARMELMREQILLMIPGMMIMSSAFTTFINYKIAMSIQKKLKRHVPYMAPFREFSLPKNILWGGLMIYVLALLASYLKIIDENVLMANLQLIMIYTFAIQGLSVMVWYMHRRSMTKAIRILFFAFILLSSMGTYILFMIGLIEIAFQVRRRLEARDSQ